MANPFYTVSGSPAFASQGASAVMRAEFAAIEAAFDKFPTFVANQWLIGNPSGTGISTLTGVNGTSWTPTLTCTTPGNLNVVYSTRVGTYARMGRVVLATARIVTSTFTHTTASGSVRITGAPVSEDATNTSSDAWGFIHTQLSASGRTQFGVTISSGVIFINAGNVTDSTILTISTFPTGVQVDLRLSIMYLAAADI